MDGIVKLIGGAVGYSVGAIAVLAAAVVAVVFLFALIFSVGSKINSLRRRLIASTKVVAKEGLISVENVELVFTEIEKLPEPVIRGWRCFMDKRQNYPSDYIPARDVLSDKAYSGRHTFGRYFMLLGGLFALIFAAMLSLKIFPSEGVSVSVDAALSLLAPIFLYAVCVVLVGAVYRKELKRLTLAYSSFQDALDDAVVIFEAPSKDTLTEEIKETNAKIAELLGQKKNDGKAVFREPNLLASRENLNAPEDTPWHDSVTDLADDEEKEEKPIEESKSHALAIIPTEPVALPLQIEHKEETPKEKEAEKARPTEVIHLAGKAFYEPEEENPVAAAANFYEEKKAEVEKPAAEEKEKPAAAAVEVKENKAAEEKTQVIEKLVAVDNSEAIIAAIKQLMAEYGLAAKQPHHHEEKHAEAVPKDIPTAEIVPRVEEQYEYVYEEPRRGRHRNEPEEEVMATEEEEPVNIFVNLSKEEEERILANLIEIVDQAIHDPTITDEDIEAIMEYLETAKTTAFKDDRDQEILTECIYLIVDEYYGDVRQKRRGGDA